MVAHASLELWRLAAEEVIDAFDDFGVDVGGQSWELRTELGIRAELVVLGEHEVRRLRDVDELRAVEVFDGQSDQHEPREARLSRREPHHRPRAEREAGAPELDAGMASREPVHAGPRVLLLGAVAVVNAFAVLDAAEVEAQHGEAGALQTPSGAKHDVVVQGAAAERMRVAHDRGRAQRQLLAVRASRRPVDRFEPTGRARDEKLHRAAYCSARLSMWNRVVILLRARLAARGAAETVPIATLFLHASVAAFLCGVVRDALSPYTYAAFALTISSGLVALPLLGEFGALLVHDEADAWVRALPISDLEQRLARALHVLIATLTQSASSLVVAAVFAPSTFTFVDRFELVAQGLLLAATVAATLVWLQSLFSARAPTLLVVLQTLLFGSVIVGAVVGVRFVTEFGELSAPTSTFVRAFPPALFAAPFEGQAHIAGAVPWPIVGWWVGALALGSLLVLPSVGADAPRRGRAWSSIVFAPLRVLTLRAWVRRDERATFELVFEALAREREVVMRSYPLIGVPLAFLALGARGEEGPAKEGLAALLLFTSATYLPVLLAHVVVSRSHRARWILDTAPTPRAALQNGAFKALVARFVVPLYVLLAVLTIVQGTLSSAALLVPIAFLLAVAVMRATWDACVHDLPMSNPPEAIEAKLNWGNVLIGSGVVLTIVAVLAWRLVDRAWLAAVICAALLALELATDRRWRRAAV